MKLGKISKEFNDYFGIGTDDELKVTPQSCRLFARIIALKAVEEYKASLVPVMWWDGDSDYPDDIMLPSIRQSHIDTNSTTYLDYPIALYAIPLGDIELNRTEIKELSEKLEKLYGVKAINDVWHESSAVKRPVWLAEDSGRISDLADDHNIDTNHNVLDSLCRDSVNSSYINGKEYISVFFNYADYPSKAAATCMARVMCLIALRETK
jgi:hypothetical protein